MTGPTPRPETPSARNMSPSISRCPICRAAALGRQVNAAFPFCGDRCQLIDLGNWLGENYRIPSDGPVDESDDSSSSSDDPS